MSELERQIRGATFVGVVVMALGEAFLIALGVGAVVGLQALLGNWWITMILLALPLLFWAAVCFGGLAALFGQIGRLLRS